MMAAPMTIPSADQIVAMHPEAPVEILRGVMEVMQMDLEVKAAPEVRR